MSTRKLNALEQEIHQAALTSGDKTLSQREIDALVPDQTKRTAALNFLLGAGLLKPLQHSGGKLSFRAVVKQELEVKKDLSPEESLVLSHIQAAANEGIWTKHLKVKTELHQTVIDRCLKSLTQKQLVKALKGSVQHPTRKIYMLFHLEPSVEMTGGPWYTDKELDTEFIKLLSAACLKFIRDRSFPRAKPGDGKQRVLYPISAAPPYPTAAQVQTFLNKSRITETQLTVEHVEMLLNVLVIDGDVEKIPALGAALWESSLGDDDDVGSSDEEKAKTKKRKRAEDSLKRKKKRRKTESSDSDSDSDDESSKRSKSKSKSKSKKRPKRSKHDSDSDDESDSDNEKQKKKRKKRKSKDTDDSDSETQSSDAESSKKKKKTKKRKSRHNSSDSESESETEEESPRKSKSRARSKSTTKRDSSPAAEYGLDDSGLFGGALVYRAIHPERMLGFGLSQAPCGRCPTFEFCKDGGPVNPGECVYYGDWLNTAEVTLE